MLPSLPEIIFEECIEFDNEEIYEIFLTYCYWFIYDDPLPERYVELNGDLAIKHDFKGIVRDFIEPNICEKMMDCSE